MCVITRGLRAANYGTPVYRVILKMKIVKELFQVNSFGHGMKDLERYGVAACVARHLVTAPVWHYTDRGNLVCGDGKNIETLPVREFTIVVDDNLDFLTETMCPCGSNHPAARKLFAVGAATVGFRREKEGKSEKGESTQHTSFSVILGEVRG